MSTQNEEPEDIAGLLIANPDPGSAEGGSDVDNTTVDDDADLDADDNSAEAGTEGDDDSGADDEAGSEGTDNELDAEPRYTITRDGKELQVTLKEALAGYQRQEDYTRKTQEIADAKKAFDEDLAAVRAHREQYAGVLKTLQERLGSEDQEPTAEQWNTLQAEEPERYAVEWANYQRRKEQREAVKAEKDRVAEETRLDRVKQAQEFVKGERVKLLDKLPAWKDPKAYEKGMTVNREYAMSSLGFSEAEVNAAYDHRFVVAIDKARRFDALMAKQSAAKRKLAAAPDMPAPGARVPATSRRQAERDAAEKRLNKTGRAEDAAALILG